MENAYSELGLALGRSEAAIAKAYAVRRALNDELDRLVTTPLTKLREVGRSVINKSWNSTQLCGLGEETAVEYPAGKDLEWVRYPFRVVSILTDHVLIEVNKPAPNRTIVGVSEQAEIPLSVLSMSDREFATMVRKAIRERKELLLARDVKEQKFKEEDNRIRDEISAHEEKIQELKRNRSELTAKRVMFRKEHP